jgi:hypothetical protein
MPKVDAVRWYRGRSDRWNTVIASLFILVSTGLCIQAGIQFPATPPLVLAGVVLACCAWFSFAVLRWHAGIGVTADHIIVRNAAGRQQLIPWPSVAGFDLGTPKYWASGLVIYVVCDDRRRLYTRGCSFQGWSNKKTLASARRMRHMLEMERQSHGSSIRL